jgi:hypothetical protein
VLLGLSVSGCAAIDALTPRAADYNERLAETKSATILTNVVRAAFAEPLQFSDIGAITGGAGVEGSVSAGIPVPFRGGLGSALAQQFINLNPSAKGTASNSFAVGNLNSQEFYRGLQEPIPKQLIYSYLAAGFNPYTVLGLLVSEFEVTYKGKGFIIRNDPTRPDRFNEFYSAMNVLIQGGLSGETIADNTKVGPPLSIEEARDPKLLAAIIAAAEPPALEKQKDRPAYQLVKRGATTRFCFKRSVEPILEKVVASGLSGPVRRQLDLVYPPSPEWRLLINAGDLCGASEKDIALANAGATLKLRPRSLAGAFYYLGELVRTEFGLGTVRPEDLGIPRSDRPEFRLFHVNRGANPRNGIVVSHRGEQFGIEIDPTGEYDGSSRAMQLLTDLIALQSNSKSLPTPTVLTVLNQ